eukprot:242762-Pleurochrysis_carterae.AAC.1
MNVALAEALLAAAGVERSGAGEPTATGASGDGIEEPVDGGRIADGPGLSAFVRARVETARATPPRFTSLRNLAPESPAAVS